MGKEEIVILGNWNVYRGTVIHEPADHNSKLKRELGNKSNSENTCHYIVHSRKVCSIQYSHVLLLLLLTLFYIA